MKDRKLVKSEYLALRLSKSEEDNLAMTAEALCTTKAAIVRIALKRLFAEVRKSGAVPMTDTHTAQAAGLTG